MYDRESLIQRAKIFDALSDPTRLGIVQILSAGIEVSSSELASQLGISLALLCHHSKILVEIGLVRRRQDGQSKYHSLNRTLLSDSLAQLLNCGQAGVD
jgi:ArsR family transcriptional regulator, arsenate/arsenite/antimonite-responsive transcriptional repressor